MKPSPFEAIATLSHKKALKLAMQQTKEIMAVNVLNRALGPRAWDGAWYATYLAAHAAALRARALDNPDGD